MLRYFNTNFEARRWPVRLCAVITALGSLAGACSSPPREATRDPSATQTEPATHLSVNALADSQLARFLSASVATRVPRRGLFDSVRAYFSPEPGGDVSGGCPWANGDYDEARWLADFRVLSVRARGDSADGTAAITTVATEKLEIEPNGNSGFVAEFRIDEDTAHWNLIRNAQTYGRWKVCGGAKEGFEVSTLSEPGMRWRNGSAALAHAAVDSIRRARGLPLAR